MGFKPFKIFSPFLGAAKNLFGGGRDASKAAFEEMRNIPGYGREAYNPFIAQGAAASKTLDPIYERMATDPDAYINELMGKYQPSTSYQRRLSEMMRGAEAASASVGGGGSQDEARRADLVRQLLGEDEQEFLANRLNLQGVGVQGLENRVGRGFQGSGNLADYLGTSDLNKANLKFQGVQQKDINQNAMFQNILKMAAAAFGASQGMPMMPGGAEDGSAGAREHGASSGSFKPLRSIGKPPTRLDFNFNPATYRR